MAKISYPEDGLERCAKEKADNCIEKLQAVLNDMDMLWKEENKVDFDLSVLSFEELIFICFRNFS